MGRRNKSRHAGAGRRKASRKLEPLRPSASDHGSSLKQRINRVRQALEKKSAKSALDMAKQLHKEVRSTQTEQLLVEVYQARIADMHAKGMVQEAKALTDLVLERFDATGELLETQRVLACQQGDPAALIKPLADPNLSTEQRRELEQFLMREWVEMQNLAQCPVLPPDHNLRRAAGAVWQALVAVTTEAQPPIGDLQAVSRRSPLAPWKLLVRVLAALYQGDIDACRQSLQTLPAESAPARLVPVIETLLEGRKLEHLAPPARSLVARLQGDQGQLKDLLVQLDDALATRDQARILSLVKKTMSCCRQTCLDLEVLLMQRLSVKCALARIHVDRVVAAMGGHARHDAAFWRFFARAHDTQADPAFACALWEQFRYSAVAEGWFAQDGPEVAFLYRHMAEVLGRVPSEELQEIRYEYEYEPPVFDYFYLEGQPREIRNRIPDDDSYDDLYYLDAGQLYQRACAIRPDAETYRRWWDWSRKEGLNYKAYDIVAERWSKHVPGDARPWLCLAESAEERGAYTKALKFITRAESLGSGDPKVKRARWRLWVHKALDHLKTDKPALATQDLEALEGLPQATETDNAFLMLALQWMTALLDGRNDLAREIRLQLQGRFEPRGASDLMLVSILRHCHAGEAVERGLTRDLRELKIEETVLALVRAWSVIRAMPVAMQILSEWQSPLQKFLQKKTSPLDVAQLTILAELCLVMDWKEVAYFCGGHGLRDGGRGNARLLFFRARSLPYGQRKRCMECTAAAAELARRQRDMNLVAEIVDWVRGQRMGFGSFGLGVTIDDLSLDDKDLNAVLERERKQRKYPQPRWDGVKRSSLEEGDHWDEDECQCPDCQRRRQLERIDARKARTHSNRSREPLLFEDCFDEPEPLDEDLGGNVPPADVVDMLVELVKANNGCLPKSSEDCQRILLSHPDLADEVERLMDLYGLPEDMDSPFSPPSRRQRKKRKKRR